MSLDMERSGAFYKKVVGWTLAPNEMNDQPYTVLKAGDTMVGGLMPIPEDAAKMGARPAWMGYIAVDDVDASAGKVKAAGGSIYRPPSEIPNIGRFAVMGDPHGAAFIIFKGSADMAPDARSVQAGTFRMARIARRGRGDRFAFYSELFGWTKADTFDMGPMGIYQLFNIDGAMAGGMMTKMPQTPMPHWLYYINVEGAEAAAGRVTKAGGKVLNGPQQVPGGQWVVQALDPQGAMIGLLAPVK